MRHLPHAVGEDGAGRVSIIVMTLRTNRPAWALVPWAAALALPAFAQQDPTLNPVVVTATRSAVPLTDLLADVSVIDRDAIEQSGALSVADLLKRQPGLTISQTGGPASPTSVFVRGADGRFTAVFVDGVRVDSQATGGASWEGIPLAQIDRIEVLRGPAAAIYGSDAVGGVVQLFTRQGEAGFFPTARVAVGRYGTRELSAGLRGGEGAVDYALGVSQDRSDGFDAKPAGNNHDRDGYRNQAFSGRLGWKLAPGQKIDLTVLDSNTESGYDGSPAPKRDIAKRHLQTVGANWSSRWSDTWSTRVGMTQGTDRYETSPSVYKTDTDVRTYLLRNELRLAGGLVTADVERREDALQNSETQPTAHTKRHQNALALGYGVRAGAHSLQVNARRDDDSEFGGKSTGALAYGYALTPTLRATASTGTAFRVPTLYQRFSIYGSAGLQPETSRNNELGLRWQSGADRLSVVAYRSTIANLINWEETRGGCINASDPDYPGCFANTGHARLSGTTLSGATQVARVNLSASVDWMTPTNTDTGKLLARRPKQQATLAASTPVAGWRLGAELQDVGARYDDAWNTTRLAPYTLLHLSLARQIDRDWRLIARVDNVTDQAYALARGYATPGRAFSVALSWAPQR